MPDRQYPCAFGYSSFADAASDARVVCVSEEPDVSCFVPGIETITEQAYPITRPLYIFTSGPASGDIENDLDWILGDEGQCFLLASRYVPIRDIDCEPKQGHEATTRGNHVYPAGNTGSNQKELIRGKQTAGRHKQVPARLSSLRSDLWSQDRVGGY